MYVLRLLSSFVLACGRQAEGQQAVRHTTQPCPTACLIRPPVLRATALPGLPATNPRHASYYIKTTQSLTTVQSTYFAQNLPRDANLRGSGFLLAGRGEDDGNPVFRPTLNLQSVPAETGPPAGFTEKNGLVADGISHPQQADGRRTSKDRSSLIRPSMSLGIPRDVLVFSHDGGSSKGPEKPLFACRTRRSGSEAWPRQNRSSNATGPGHEARGG